MPLLRRQPYGEAAKNPGVSEKTGNQETPILQVGLGAKSRDGDTRTAKCLGTAKDKVHTEAGMHAYEHYEKKCKSLWDGTKRNEIFFFLFNMVIIKYI